MYLKIWQILLNLAAGWDKSTSFSLPAVPAGNQSHQQQREEDRESSCAHASWIRLWWQMGWNCMLCVDCMCKLCFIDDLATWVTSDKHTKLTDPCVWRLFIIKVEGHANYRSLPGDTTKHRSTAGEGVKIREKNRKKRKECWQVWVVCESRVKWL